MTRADFSTRVWLHRNSYGRALRIPARWVRIAYTAVCLLTPATNWTIPLVAPRLRSITWRYS